MHRGTPTRQEMLLAAVAFAGPGCAVTGLAALREVGVRAAARASRVDVLVPASRQRRSWGDVHLERTRRIPRPVLRAGVPYAPVPRATVDACRGLSQFDEVRALVAEVVQRRLCTVESLRVEVSSAASSRTGLVRRALAEVAYGVRSVAEARARDVYRRYQIPQPAWNVTLVDHDGVEVARPDAYWEAVVAAVEIDSMAWHLSPESYRRTQHRQRELLRHGVLVLPVAPGDILDDEAQFVRDTLDLLRVAAARPRPTTVSVLRPGPA